MLLKDYQENGHIRYISTGGAIRSNKGLSLELWEFTSRGGALAGCFSLERVPAPAPAGFVTGNTNVRCACRRSWPEGPPKSTAHLCPVYRAQAAGSRPGRGRSFSSTFRRRASSSPWEAEGGWHSCPRYFSSKAAGVAPPSPPFPTLSMASR